jgi:hypothetical protein
MIRVNDLRTNPVSMTAPEQHRYALQKSGGQVFGPACPMLESEAEDGNRTMGSAYSECRWTLVPESVNYHKGSVECSGCLQDMALAGKAVLLLKLACARCTDMGNRIAG